MKRSETRAWLTGAIAGAALATMALTVGRSVAAPGPAQPLQFIPIPVEQIDGGQPGSLHIERFLVSGPNASLDRVMTYVDGGPRYTDSVVVELSVVAHCPIDDGCLPCDPRGGDCTGIPPIPPPRRLPQARLHAVLAAGAAP